MPVLFLGLLQPFLLLLLLWLLLVFYCARHNKGWLTLASWCGPVASSQPLPLHMDPRLADLFPRSQRASASMSATLLAMLHHFPQVGYFPHTRAAAAVQTPEAFCDERSLRSDARLSDATRRCRCKAFVCGPCKLHWFSQAQDSKLFECE
ncbi:hypothetical protein BX666DRAFT_1118569 [Dichotomocladium elegans]|nr:hypothetical protein BX666DRAFT_1118569 [Dichotomocladium elegans]